MKSLVSLALVSFLCGFAAHAGVKAGAQAPQFSLMGSDGKTHDLKSQSGKYVVLEWYNEGCPYVKKHYRSGNMQSTQKEVVGKDVVWYSVISSKPGSQGHVNLDGAKKLLKSSQSNATAILLDEDGKVGKAYGATTTPHMFIINPEGKVVYQGAIDDKPSASKKSLKGAKNYVKAAFSDLNGKKSVQVSDTKPYGCGIKY